MNNDPIEVCDVSAHYDEQGKFVERRILKIYMDDDPVNPRKEWDNFGHMVCFHRQYDLGDEDKHGIDAEYHSSWNEMGKYLIKKCGAAVILPLYLYDHSGITMRTHCFHDGWDSGQVGFIYATRKDILENWPATIPKKLTKDLIEKAYNLLRTEVQEYDDYLTGNVYGYILEENGDEICSCWGYFGDDAIARIKSELHMNLPTEPANSQEGIEAQP